MKKSNNNNDINKMILKLKNEMEKDLNIKIELDNISNLNNLSQLDLINQNNNFKFNVKITEIFCKIRELDNDDILDFIIN